MNLSVSVESGGGVTLTWDEPPGFEGIVGFWYRVQLHTYSSYGAINITTPNRNFTLEVLAPSTRYCASVRAESVHSSYTYYSNSLCFTTTNGSQGECVWCMEGPCRPAGLSYSTLKTCSLLVAVIRDGVSALCSRIS